MKLFLIAACITSCIHVATAQEPVSPTSQEEKWQVIRDLEVARQAKAETFFKNGQYPEALAMYRELRANPPFTPAVCLNGMWSREYELAFKEGTCMEYLKQYEEALKAYSSVILLGDSILDRRAHFRIFDLYKKQNQIPDLIRILDEWDAPFVRSATKHPQNLQHRPSLVLRRFLQIEQWAQEHKWDELIGLLSSERTPDFSHWIVEQTPDVYWTAELLAQHSQETVPLMISYLQNPESRNRFWFYYTLALSDTPQARSMVIEEATKYHIDAESLVNTLTTAGKGGPKILASLQEAAKSNNQTPRVFATKSITEVSGKITFPPVPHKLKLPTSLPSPSKLTETDLLKGL
jgi:tetratricopeptide (TPR) repeat protein